MGSGRLTRSKKKSWIKKVKRGEDEKPEQNKKRERKVVNSRSKSWGESSSNVGETRKLKGLSAHFERGKTLR